MKKGLLIVMALAIAIATVPMFAAFEAHVINVTARIENALSVSTTPIEFGTVFPQEYLITTTTIALSGSFLEESDADDVNYVIKQKPKPKNPDAPVPQGFDTWHDYCAASLLDLENCYPLLCPYISKHPDGLPESGNDGSLDAFHDPGVVVEGRLAKSEQDTEDLWTFDLDVPCFDCMCDQGWDHEGWELPTILEGEVFGCDLWIEVTSISRYSDVD